MSIICRRTQANSEPIYVLYFFGLWFCLYKIQGNISEVNIALCVPTHCFAAFPLALVAACDTILDFFFGAGLSALAGSRFLGVIDATKSSRRFGTGTLPLLRMV